MIIIFIYMISIKCKVSHPFESLGHLLNHLHCFLWEKTSYQRSKSVFLLFNFGWSTHMSKAIGIKWHFIKISFSSLNKIYGISDISSLYHKFSNYCSYNFMRNVNCIFLKCLYTATALLLGSYWMNSLLMYKFI